MACGWVYLTVALGAWALLRAADLWWPATLLMFSPRWFLALPSVVLIPATAALRPRSLGPPLLALAFTLGPIMGLCIPSPFSGSGVPPKARVRVLTCNMHYRKLNPGPLDRLIDDTRPDVVALQEWMEPNHSEVLAGGGWHTHRTDRLFLASRYPIRSAAAVVTPALDQDGPVGRYELETPDGVVTFFNLHLATPRKGLQEVIDDDRNGTTALRAGSKLRGRQSKDLAGQAATAAGAVLLAGDFNTPPESVLFRRVWSGYTDAFGAAGLGWGYTFVGWGTAVRIDHILAGPGWRCERAWVGADVGSPHHPVLADLVWVPESDGR